MEKYVLPTHGSGANYLAIESNASTRSMYKKLGIKAIDCLREGSWSEIPTNKGLPVNQTLTISNWNLERILPTQKRLGDIQNYFSKSQADIWFLTETHVEVDPNEGYFPVLVAPLIEIQLMANAWMPI